MVKTSELCHEKKVGRGHPPGSLGGSVRDQDSGMEKECHSTVRWVVPGGERMGMFILISEFPERIWIPYCKHMLC